MANEGPGRKELEGELYRLMVENLHDYAVFMIDRHGRVQSWNPGAERLLGYSEAEIIGKPIDIFFTPEDLARGVPKAEMAAAAESGRGPDDRWHVRKDGSRFWAGGMMTPLRGPEGNLRGYAKIMRDRTDWKRKEEELKQHTLESERRRRLYEAALSNTPDFVYVFDLDHHFIYVNQGLLRMWGRTWDEAIGKNCLELGYEPWHAAMHGREIDEVVATRQPIKGEVPFTGTFGRRVYEYIFTPVFGEDGEVEAVAGTTRDVTERQQSEDRVRQSEERFRSLMEQAPVSIQLLSSDGRTVRVNRAWEELWGLRLEQLSDYNILYDPQLEVKGVAPHLRRAFGGEPAEIPAIEYDPDETIPNRTAHENPKRWVSALAYPLKDAAGAVREVVLIHRDVTVQRRAEQELRDADRRKDEFLATLAHELRNPLAPIRNSLELLKMPQADAGMVRETRAVMERQVDHLVRLVDDLLDVSRVMQGKIELRRERVDLLAVIARAVETAEPLVTAHGHRLEMSLPPESLVLDADPVRLSQVVANLLTNAAKYTEPGGRIRLAAGLEGEEAVLRIRDNGIGISPEQLPHIFDLFVQVDHASSRSQGGLGIGLTLVKNLVGMHNGTVTAHSDGLGAGSEFVVRLPLLESQGRQDTAVGLKAEPARISSSVRHRVLVVDDNKDGANSLAMLLQMNGCDVEVAFDGAEGVKLATATAPQLIFLDIGMPKMDGYEVARRIRAAAGCEEAVLVALTGWGQQEHRRRTREAGFDHHLVKPLELAALERILASLDSSTRHQAR